MNWQNAIRFIFVGTILLLLTLPINGQEPTEIESPPTLEAPVVKGGRINQPRNNRRGNARANRAPADRANIRSGKSQPGKPESGNFKPGAAIKVNLPDDPNAVVLMMDIVGGFRMKLPDGFEETPMLQVYADGRVLTGRKSPLVKEVEGKLDLVELQSLMAFVADDCRFFDITSELLKSEIEASRSGRIMDAGTTQFSVDLKDHSNEVEVYALPNAAEELADAPAVASVVAMASRCRRLISMTRLGSHDEAMRVLDSVNQSLSKKVPTAPPFALENLQYAEQFTDGRRSVTFIQNFTEANQQMVAYATFQVDVKGQESASVDVIQKR